MTFDLCVIGGGSGGVRAARKAAETGAKVAIIEGNRFGGTCVIRGCVPKKLYSYAAHFAHDFEDAKGFGWHVESSAFNWDYLVKAKEKEITRLEGIYEMLLAKTHRIKGYGRFKNANIVLVDGQEITAKRFLIATGGTPFRPDIPGIEHAVTSDEVFDLATLPQSVVIYGGGYIALEFACIFAGLGVKTTVVYRRGRLLSGFDQETAEFLTQEIQKKGVNIRFDTEITQIEKDKVHLNNGDELPADCVLLATGRKPNIDGLNLEATGVHVVKGAIDVNATYQTHEPNIFAIGDVINHMALTPVAIRQAMVFVDNEFKGENRTLNLDKTPTAIFTHPPMATCGLSEEKAKETYDIAVYKSDFRPLMHTLSQSSERTFMKMIVDKKTDEVLGVHMVGKDAAEMMQGLGIAMHMGATKQDFDKTIGIHPTSAEEWVTL